MKRSFRPKRLRFHLAILVLTSTLPLLVFAAVVALVLERQQRAALDRGLQDTARALTVAVDHELVASISALQALATSAHLDAGDFKSFYDQAQRALQAHPGWKTINVFDLSGQQRLNLLRPFGAPLPASPDLDVVRRVLDSGRPAISDLFVGPVSQAPIIGIAVPVTRGGSLKYVLGAGLDVLALSRLLEEGRLPPDWLATIIDGKGIIVARTRDIDRWLAHAGSPGFVAQSRQFEEGSFRDVTKEGVTVHGAHSRSRLSGWAVGLGVPAAAVAAPGRRSAWVLIGGGLVCVLIAALTAALVGKRINRGIGSLSAFARALGSETLPAMTGGSSIAEVETAKRELAEATRERADAIAARLTTEEALRESEERTRLIVAHALDAVVTIDVQGRITSWNPQAERLFGWSPEEALGRSLSETVIPPDYREAHERGLAHFRATGQGPVLNRHLELTALHRDGTEFPVELAITPIRIGGATVFSAFLRDITERKRAEEDRRQSEASFRLLFENNPLPMWVYDLATLYFLEVNTAAVEHYGYSRDEFLRMRITDIRPPDDVPRLREVVAGLATDTGPAGRRHSGTWSHRLKDGRIRQVDIVSHAIEFGGRRAALVVATDVTELRQAEASLAQYADRLKILHEIDAAIIGAQAPVAIAEAALRPLRDLLGVPRAIVNLFDFAAGEAEWLAAIGRRRTHVGPGVRFPLALMGDVEALRRGELQVVDTTAQAPSPAVDALLASGVRTYMVVPMIAGGELIGGISFGGEPGEFSPEQIDIAREVAAQLAIAIAHGRLYERVKRQAAELEERVRDRTLELSAANEQLQQEIGDRRRAEAEADRANRAKSDFLSRMSHELRTPLNAILGFGQLLETRVEQPRDRESVDQILKGGRHLLNLINEVLDISRIESGRLSLSPEPVRLGEVISHVVDMTRPLAVERRVHIHADSAVRDDRFVRADTQRLRQVLLNLVSNGIKYNREGGRLTLACHEADTGRLRITVSDTGAGIPLALHSRLFTPFDRLGVEAQGVEGTGLGLALSKRLLEAMGGTIGFDSREGEGTTFWVELPQTDAPRTRGEASASEDLAGARAGERQGTILYIEDNPSNLRLVERVLAERSALQLIPAMHGRVGLGLAREHRPDVILVDLHLPDMSGADVLRELRGDAELRKTPVIILSADATPGQIKRLLAAGAQAFLTKPLDIQQLLSVLDASLPAR